MILNKYANVFLSMALVFVASTVVWYSLGNYNNFLIKNQLLAEKSVHSTAREIEFFINERKRYIDLFADQEKELLSDLIRDPSNMFAYQQLEKKINAYFPNRFSFTIAQIDGTPILGQHAELIGNMCRNDIRHFSQDGRKHKVYVHSSPGTSRKHLDIMTAFVHDADVPSVFFVSFFLDDIFRLLEHGVVDNHHLFLVNRGNPSVIEATTSGTLDIYRQHDHIFELMPPPQENEARYIWPDSMNRQVISMHAVAGTRWELLGVVEPKLIPDYVTRLLHQAGVILLLFLIVTLMGFWLTKRLGVLSGDTRVILNSIENERQRIAMDLHDEVLCDISQLRRDCHKADQSMLTTEYLNLPVRNIDNALEQITDTIRNIIDDLHPQSIEILGLAATIRSYCRKHYDQQAMKTNLMINSWDETRLNQVEKINIFRIFQESMHNVNKHANATQCDIKLHMTQQNLLLSVTDNGVGLVAMNAKQAHGRGMTNITVRGRIIQAKTVWTVQSKGTVFSLELPLPNENED